MGFLTPLFLLGLLAAALPVAIHLIRRENPPKVLFGTLRFMKQTTRKLILFQQIQQWLLLLLRSALICLLVVAFARPLLYQGDMARLLDAEPRSVVIVLDVSLSMHAGERFERARSSALELLDSLRAGDEAAVLTFADGTLAVRELSTDLAALRAFVGELPPPGYDRARFYPALQLANDLLAQAQHDQRELVMISDFKASGMNDAPGDFMLAPGIAFQPLDVGDERSSNLSLTDVRSPQQLLETRSDYEILARVRSTGSVFLERGELTLNLLNDSASLADTRAVQLNERSEAVIQLPLSLDASALPATGSYMGELALSSDDFELDNRWYFSLDVLPRMRVLVVNGDPSSDWYDDEAHWFVLALQGMESSPFEVTVSALAQLSTAQLSAHDALVLLNTPRLPDAMLAALERFVQDGGALWLAPGDQVNAEDFNAQFADLSPARLLSAELLPGNDYQLIADVDRRHPALRALSVDFGARFQGYWRSDVQADAGVMMRFDNGEAMLSERRVGQGRSILLSTALDLGWSNFPLQGLYLPFAHEVLSYLIQPPARERAWLVGQMIDLTPFYSDMSSDSAAELELREPDGTLLRVPASNPFYRARMPGFVQIGDSTLAINIAPEAASLTRLDIAALTDRIINPETVPQVSERVRTAQLIADIEQPQRLWWWIVLLVLLLLTAEMWVANRTYR